MSESTFKTNTVGIVAPHEDTQFAISTLLSQQPDTQVVGIRREGEEGLRMLIETKPRIAILEIDLENRSAP